MGLRIGHPGGGDPVTASERRHEAIDAKTGASRHHYRRTIQAPGKGAFISRPLPLGGGAAHDHDSTLQGLNLRPYLIVRQPNFQCRGIFFGGIECEMFRVPRSGERMLLRGFVPTIFFVVGETSSSYSATVPLR